MWRYADGDPAAHPTFSLALFNYKSMQSLQHQGKFVADTSDIDPNSTKEEMLCNNTNDDVRQAKTSYRKCCKQSPLSLTILQAPPDTGKIPFLSLKL
jgi:hypothetical protein